MKTKTKVLMVVANTLATDTRVRREASTLNDGGYDVEVLCWDRQGSRPRTEIIDGYRVRNLQIGRTTSLVSSKAWFLVVALLLQVAIIRQAAMILGSSRRLIVHSNDFNTLPGCAFVRRAFPRRISLIYDSHELTEGVYREWYGRITAAVVGACERLMIKNVDAAIGANDIIASYLSDESNRPAVAVYNCPISSEIPEISATEAKKLFQLDGKFVVLFAGRVRQEYDFELLIQAARKFADRQIRFVIVAPPDTLEPLRCRVEEEEVSAVFDFRGWMQYDRLLLLYKASDLCFLVVNILGPNTRSLTPIKLFESMACGLPVVVRDNTFAAEIVRSAQCGVVVREPEDFERQLEAMLSRSEPLLHLGEGGRTAFIGTYNWEKMGSRFLAQYQRLSRL